MPSKTSPDWVSYPQCSCCVGLRSTAALWRLHRPRLLLLLLEGVTEEASRSRTTRFSPRLPPWCWKPTSNPSMTIITTHAIVHPRRHRLRHRTFTSTANLTQSSSKSKRRTHGGSFDIAPCIPSDRCTGRYPSRALSLHLYFHMSTVR